MRPENTRMVDLPGSVGGWFQEAIVGAGEALTLLYETVRRLGPANLSRARLRDVVHQMSVGVMPSLPIVLLVSLFMGMVLALQTGIELGKFGQQDLIGGIVSVAMCREMGPLVSGIILVAAVGSAMAAEIATMSVSDELTALDVMTVDKIRFLIVPRVAALALMSPLLTIFADLVGVIGGGVIAVGRLGVSEQMYINRTIDALRTQEFFSLPKDIFVGVLKSFIFGIAIAIVSCACGMRATNGARGVGEATRRAVRTSILLLVVLNYIITGLFFGLMN